MRTKLGVLLVFLLALSLTAVLSCSKNTSRPEEVINGDPNSPEFSQTREMVDGAVAEAIGQFRAGLDFTEGVEPPPLPKVGAPGDTIYEWTYQDGWWWCYLEYSDSVYQITLLDSVQFRSEGVAQMFPDSTTSELELKVDSEISCEIYAFALWFDLLYTGLNTDLITLDGEGGYDFSGYYSEQAFYYCFSENLEGVTFQVASNYEQAYPTSGTLTVAVTENLTNLSCNDPQGETSWSIELTFHPDHYHVRAQTGNTVYEYDQEYPV